MSSRSSPHIDASNYLPLYIIIFGEASPSTRLSNTKKLSNLPVNFVTPCVVTAAYFLFHLRIMAQHYKKEDITKSRVKVFLGWEHFNPLGNVPPNRKDQNLASRLWTSRSREAVSLSVASPSSALVSPTAATLQTLDYRPAAIGEKFGPTFATHVFCLDIIVPQSMRDQEVHLLWDSNSEALVLDHNGVPRQGLVGGDHWARRADYNLFPNFEHRNMSGEMRVKVYIEIACNGLFGAGRGGDIEPPDMDSYYTLEECCIAVFNRKAWSLLHDLTLLASLADQLPDGPRKTSALYVANDVVNAVRVDDPSTFEHGTGSGCRIH